MKDSPPGEQTPIAVLIAATDRERAQLGYELHDSVAQSLAAIRYQLMALEQVEPANAAVTEQIRTLRNSVGELLEEVRVLALRVHPRIVDDLGLLVALRRLAREGDDRPHVSVTLAAGTESDVRMLSRDVSRVLYRVAQEALDNAERHSEATAVDITLSFAAGSVSLQISDNGHGFDLTIVGDPVRSTGLLLLRERLLTADGTLTVTSHQETGTVVHAHVTLGQLLPTRE
ncbi:MAG: histidine kinase [Gemmatimonadaceae bacterium]